VDVHVPDFVPVPVAIGVPDIVAIAVWELETERLAVIAAVGEGVLVTVAVVPADLEAVTVGVDDTEAVAAAVGVPDTVPDPDPVTVARLAVVVAVTVGEPVLVPDRVTDAVLVGDAPTEIEGVPEPVQVAVPVPEMLPV
jgi:hypothetical protein